MVIDDAKEHGIQVKTYKNYHQIDKSFKMVGYFDEKRIAVLRNDKWLDTLTHEYAHFIQWREGHPSYKAYNITPDPIFLTEKYFLDATVPHDKNVKESFNIIRQNEFECNQLAIKLIKKHNLPVDLDNYKKKSNQEILFYHCAEKHRNHNPSRNFYGADFLNLIPNTLQSKYVSRPPVRILEEACKYFV